MDQTNLAWIFSKNGEKTKKALSNFSFDHLGKLSSLPSQTNVIINSSHKETKKHKN